MTLVGLGFRNIRRNRLRTALTIVAVAIAVFLFVVLRTVVHSWTAEAEGASRQHLVTRHKVAIIIKLPIKYAEIVRNAPHVVAATHFVWFGGHVPKREEDYFDTFAGDPKAIFDVYQGEMDLPADQRARFEQNRKGAIVGRQLARRFKWNVGDTVILESGAYANPDGPWTFTIEGIYDARSKALSGQVFFLHYELVNQSLPPSRQNEIGWVLSRVDSAASPTDTAAAIDRLFEAQDIQTVTQDEQTFQKQFLGSIVQVLRAIDIVTLVLFLITGLILANTMAMAVRERVSEYGVLKALGFRGAAICTFIVGEAAFIALLGGVAGLLVAVPLLDFGLAPIVEENLGAIFPSFRVPLSAVLGAIGLSLGLGVVSTLLPSIQAVRLRTVDALRGTH